MYYYINYLLTLINNTMHSKSLNTTKIFTFIPQWCTSLSCSSALLLSIYICLHPCRKYCTSKEAGCPPMPVWRVRGQFSLVRRHTCRACQQWTSSIVELCGIYIIRFALSPLFELIKAVILTLALLSRSALFFYFIC